MACSAHACIGAVVRAAAVLIIVTLCVSAACEAAEAAAAGYGYAPAAESLVVSAVCSALMASVIARRPAAGERYDSAEFARGAWHAALGAAVAAAVLVAAFFDDIRLTQDVAVDLLLVFVSFWVALCWRQLLDDMSRGAVPDPDQETGPRAEQVAAAAARGPK